MADERNKHLGKTAKDNTGTSSANTPNRDGRGASVRNYDTRTGSEEYTARTQNQVHTQNSVPGRSDAGAQGRYATESQAGRGAHTSPQSGDMAYTGYDQQRGPRIAGNAYRQDLYGDYTGNQSTRTYSGTQAQSGSGQGLETQRSQASRIQDYTQHVPGAHEKYSAGTQQQMRGREQTGSATSGEKYHTESQAGRSAHTGGGHARERAAYNTDSSGQQQMQNGDTPGNAAQQVSGAQGLSQKQTRQSTATDYAKNVPGSGNDYGVQVGARSQGQERVKQGGHTTDTHAGRAIRTGAEERAGTRARVGESEKPLKAYTERAESTIRTGSAQRENTKATVGGDRSAESMRVNVNGERASGVQSAGRQKTGGTTGGGSGRGNIGKKNAASGTLSENGINLYGGSRGGAGGNRQAQGVAGGIRQGRAATGEKSTRAVTDESKQPAHARSGSALETDKTRIADPNRAGRASAGGERSGAGRIRTDDAVTGPAEGSGTAAGTALGDTGIRTGSDGTDAGMWKGRTGRAPSERPGAVKKPASPDLQRMDPGEKRGLVHKEGEQPRGIANRKKEVRKINVKEIDASKTESGKLTIKKGGPEEVSEKLKTAAGKQYNVQKKGDGIRLEKAGGGAAGREKRLIVDKEDKVIVGGKGGKNTKINTKGDKIAQRMNGIKEKQLKKIRTPSSAAKKKAEEEVVKKIGLRKKPRIRSLGGILGGGTDAGVMSGLKGAFGGIFKRTVAASMATAMIGGTVIGGSSLIGKSNGQDSNWYPLAAYVTAEPAAEADKPIKPNTTTTEWAYNMLKKRLGAYKASVAEKDISNIKNSAYKNLKKVKCYEVKIDGQNAPLSTIANGLKSVSAVHTFTGTVTRTSTITDSLGRVTVEEETTGTDNGFSKVIDTKSVKVNYEFVDAEGNKKKNTKDNIYTGLREEIKEAQKDGGGGGGGSRRSSSGTSSAGRKKVYIGDSRTVGMYCAQTGGPFGMDVNTSDAQGNYWSARIGMSYPWMVSTGIPQAEPHIGEDTDVVILMGINGVENTGMADQYASYINGKAAEWSARGANTYFASVNPVGNSGGSGSYNTGLGVTLTNDMVQAFNNRLQSSLSSDVTYLDVYNEIIGSYQTQEGLHYTDSTSVDIYNIINELISSGSKKGKTYNKKDLIKAIISMATVAAANDAENADKYFDYCASILDYAVAGFKGFKVSYTASPIPGTQLTWDVGSGTEELEPTTEIVYMTVRPAEDYSWDMFSSLDPGLDTGATIIEYSTEPTEGSIETEMEVTRSSTWTETASCPDAQFVANVKISVCCDIETLESGDPNPGAKQYWADRKTAGGRYQARTYYDLTSFKFGEVFRIPAYLIDGDGKLAYLEWMRRKAANPGTFYLYGAWGDDGLHYDCSGFVSRALHETDFPESGRFDTTREGAVLTELGFEEFAYTGMEALEEGDILVNPNPGTTGHTETYNGDGELVGARGGDGVKITIGPYYEFDVQYFYRPPDWLWSSGGGGSLEDFEDIDVSDRDRQMLEAFRANIMANMDSYLAAEEATGVPWQFICAIHMREAGCDPGKCIANGQPRGNYTNVDGFLVHADPYEDAIYSAGKMIEMAQQVYGVDISEDQSIEAIGNTALSWNRGYMYKLYPGGEYTYMDSPYVSNHFFSDEDMRWCPADWTTPDGRVVNDVATYPPFPSPGVLTIIAWLVQEF